MHRRPLLVAAAVAVALGFLEQASGGYFAEQWGVLMLAFALAGLVALVLSHRLRVSRGEIVTAAGLLAFAVWQAVSALWTTGDGPAVQAGELTLLYAAAAVALALTLQVGDELAVLYGVVTAAVFASVDGLVTHLFPDEPRDPLTYRFVGPIGYSNAAGILAAIGVLLVLWLAFTGGRAQRLVAAFWAVPLAGTLYLTLSRGSMIALAAGFLVVLAVADARGRWLAGLATLAVPVAVAVAWLANQPSLTGPAPLAQMQSEGREAALALVLLGGVSAALAWAFSALEARVRPGRRARRALAAAAIVVIGALAAAVLIREGGPVDLGRRAVDSFRALPAEQDETLERRLLSASSSVRSSYWEVAAGMAGRSPLLGEGAGSFDRWWAQERPLLHEVRNAHNLYLETVAETGLVGGVLLAIALLPPLVAARRSRHLAPAGAAAVGAYAMFLVHAALDWDWQIPLVTLAGLACGFVALLPLRRESRVTLETGTRVLASAVLVLVLAVALVAHVGNGAAADSELALERGDTGKALADARTAQRWMPWSSVPHELEGEAAISLVRLRVARTALRRATELDPESWRAWYDLALVSVGAERRRAVASALALNPKSQEVRRLRTGAGGS